MLIYGALSMIGAPLTPGFSGKWALVSFASQQSTQGAIIIVIALTAGIVGLIRWAVKFWEPGPAEDFSEISRSNAVRIVAGLSLIMGIIIALSPEFVGELIIHITVP
jgi:NADH:ubiquinone oxidoreductase subunit 2 (subunit N)